jgi:hypothetical protein
MFLQRTVGMIAIKVSWQPNTKPHSRGISQSPSGALDELVATVEGLRARHEALEALGILTPLVFCRRRGQAVKTFRTRWRTACVAGGCPGRIPHDFRRTAVRNLNRPAFLKPSR